MGAVRHLVALALLVASVILAGVGMAPAAAGAQGGRIFWGNTGDNTISYAYLSGSGGGKVVTTGATVNSPAGVALDPVGGRVWWTEAADSAIAYAGLNTSLAGTDLAIPGTTVASPVGIVVDSLGGKLYFASAGTNQIFSANLDGSGATEIDTTGATVSSPHGVAVDAARQRIYWASYSGNEISYAELDGSAAGDLDTTGVAGGVGGPNGVALDSTSGRIYWANRTYGSITYANADGSGGGGNVNTAGATTDAPYGVAIDPAAGRIWWANHGGNTISWAALDGSGGGDLDTSAVPPSSPNMPALLQAPVGTGAPSVTGVPVVGAPLSCSGASWGDAFPQNLYRLPSSVNFTWFREGAQVAFDKVSATYFPAAPGVHTCMVKGLNSEGEASQTSAGVQVSAALSVGTAKLNKKAGTAKLTVTPAAAGSLNVSGKGVKTQARTVAAAGKLTVPIKPKGAAKRKLDSAGKAAVKVTVRFTPTAGRASAITKKVKLKEAQ